MLARRYLELGCTFVATGVDVLVYANAARKLAAEFLPDTATAAATRPGAAY
ncbi:alpha-dehydro-beta-deoxy-D-glucarate aldolase [compost metagenome]